MVIVLLLLLHINDYSNIELSVDILEQFYFLCFIHESLFLSEKEEKNIWNAFLVQVALKSISQHKPHDFLAISSFIIYFLLYFSSFSFFFLIRKNIFVPKLNENKSMI